MSHPDPNQQYQVKCQVCGEDMDPDNACFIDQVAMCEQCFEVIEIFKEDIKEKEKTK